MKKISITAIAAAFILVSAALCLAQTGGDQTGQSGNTMHGQGMMGPAMMGYGQAAGNQGPNGPYNCPMGMRRGMGMGGPMMGLMAKQVIAMPDGGIVVVVYDTIYRYDKNLNLVKQVQIPIDFEKLHQRMQKKMKSGWMHKGQPGRTRPAAPPQGAQGQGANP